LPFSAATIVKPISCDTAGAGSTPSMIRWSASSVRASAPS
jgi:hypothetical protein